MRTSVDQLTHIRTLLRDLRDLGSAQDAARESAAYAGPVLDRCGIDLSARPATAKLQNDASALFARMDRIVGHAPFAESPVSAHTPAALQQRLVTRLRALAAQSELKTPDLWHEAAALGERLRAALEAGRLAPRPTSAATELAITAETLTRYLGSHWTDAPDVEVSSVQKLDGGRSKMTMFVNLARHPRIAHMVLRQDVPTGMLDTVEGAPCVAHEYPLLRAAFAAGLPVPEPLWLEADETELGPPFMLTRKVTGTTPGSWRGFHQPADALTGHAVAHLAEVLARLHQLPLPGAQESSEQRMQREIAYRWTQWQRTALTPFPLIECAFERLREACRSGLGASVLVHGDVLPHNLLFAAGCVSALLDWEFAHAGDPAEDLAYCRAAVEAVMPWASFLAHYRAAGGSEVSERRLAIFGLYGLVRNSCLLASAGRLYAEGVVKDFTTGAIAYVSLPTMESLVGAQLKLLDAALKADR